MSPDGRAVTRPSESGGRLLSLDVYRGVAVGAMILVNAPGGNAPKYIQLDHMSWHGWTLTDLIFPSFLFIVGAAIPFALGKKLSRGEPRAALGLQAAKRAAFLIAAGLLGGIGAGVEGSLRLPGVLQRIGLCYLPAALLFIYGGPRASGAAALGILAAYWAALTFIPVPGAGPGDLSPAGNLASFLDRKILGARMDNGLYDPEGVLSTFPAATTTMLGVLAGVWLLSPREGRAKTAGLAAAGAAGLALGLVWDPWFPINKHLYTSSFAAFAAGAACLLLACAYWILDVRGRRAGTGALEFLGRHAFLAYCLSSFGEALADMGEFARPDGPPASFRLAMRARLFGGLPPGGSSLAWSLCWLLFWFAVCRGIVSAVERFKARREAAL